MKIKSVAALGAILLLALGTSVADARNGGGGGWGGGGGGGSHFGGGGGGGSRFSGGGGAPRFSGGGNFSGRSFRSGPNFGAGNFRGRGPRVGDRGYRQFSGNYYGRGGHGHYHRRGRYFIGYPYYGYYGDGYYGSDCAWLYRRAIETGSPYWWAQYQDCSY